MARGTAKNMAKDTAGNATGNTATSMIKTKKRGSSNVPQRALATVSLTLTDLPEKTKESWSLREAVDQLQDSITIAMQRGYTYDEIVTVLASCGIRITASSLKRYLSIVKRANSATKPRRSRNQPVSSPPVEAPIVEPVLEIVSPSRRRGRAASATKTAAKAKATPRTTAPQKRKK
ncbi:hypothetical protein [Leptolyngbya sp. FACHB-711]|uniref:hypothetical protein n=1 Tax=Leptolyngbya sp. FACHB-711 TaxID=2692813 RepID=UPI00168934FF|nr:hypothetical protein [Leptolyngbya sp. FACHB-711]MBD2027817.1 hypothetical protein [Leptolyngbya sp. FACHB-711]